MQQEQWEAAIAQLKEAREAAAQEHQRNMDKMKELAHPSSTTTHGQAVAWLANQLDMGKPTHSRMEEGQASMEREL